LIETRRDLNETKGPEVKGNMGVVLTHQGLVGGA